jgi:hypothetical protein
VFQKERMSFPPPFQNLAIVFSLSFLCPVVSITRKRVCGVCAHASTHTLTQDLCVLRSISSSEQAIRHVGLLGTVSAGGDGDGDGGDGSGIA